MNNPLDLDAFRAYAETLMEKNPNWRYGVALSHAISDIRPAWAADIFGGKLDPYWSHREDPELITFFEYIEKKVRDESAALRKTSVKKILQETER